MKLDLKALFGGDTQRIAIEEQLDFHDLQYGSYCPLRQPVRVTGQAYAKADVCYLDLDLSFVFDGVCDRCAEPIQKPMSLSLHKILVEDLQTGRMRMTNMFWYRTARWISATFCGKSYYCSFPPKCCASQTVRAFAASAARI